MDVRVGLWRRQSQRIDGFELWCWRRPLRVPWTARKSNQSILKEISPGISLEGMMLKLKLQYFGHLMQRVDSLEKTLMLGGIGDRKRRGRQRMRWLDGITNSMDMRLSELWELDGQGGLACCDSWGRKESDMTEWLHWTELMCSFLLCCWKRMFAMINVLSWQTSVIFQLGIHLTFLLPLPLLGVKEVLFSEFSFQIFWKFKLSCPWLSALLTWIWLSARAWLHLFLKYLANIAVCLIPTTPDILFLWQRIYLNSSWGKGQWHRSFKNATSIPFSFFLNKTVLNLSLVNVMCLLERSFLTLIYLVAFSITVNKILVKGWTCFCLSLCQFTK